MKLKLLTLLCALSVSALNLFADGRVVTSGTESDDGATFDYLEVSGDETRYDGTNITIANSTWTWFGVTSNYATVSLTNSSINVTSDYAVALDLGNHSHTTLNNVNTMSTNGINVYGGSTLMMTGGTIHATGNDGLGIFFSNASSTMNGVNIVGNTGLHISNGSTLILAGSDIITDYTALYISSSIVTVNLDGNTLTGPIKVWSGSLTLTGSNGSVITSDVNSNNSNDVVAITLTDAGTVMHGYLYTNDDDSGPINLTLSAGALFDGGGTVSNLILEDGAILGYTDGLTVTTSITLSGGITIDFSNITVQDGENYLILDYTTASGSVNAENFTASGLDDSLQGSFSVANNQLTFNATAVPEPTTWLLLGLGVGVLILARRRK
ncbi:MAG: PEP-CTERM sorting domain-containing protein [Verrucomicrobiales bacterium]|jgi:hypothetical protein|nr:PEP-CTERM sorting domain-containing protein [Verrucomicrobiales bacterium]